MTRVTWTTESKLVRRTAKEESVDQSGNVLDETC
jgi:hypothetical protein